MLKEATVDGVAPGIAAPSALGRRDSQGTPRRQHWRGLQSNMRSWQRRPGRLGEMPGKGVTTGEPRSDLGIIMIFIQNKKEGDKRKRR